MKDVFERLFPSQDLSDFKLLYKTQTDLYIQRKSNGAIYELRFYDGLQLHQRFAMTISTKSPVVTYQGKKIRLHKNSVDYITYKTYKILTDGYWPKSDSVEKMPKLYGFTGKIKPVTAYYDACSNKKCSNLNSIPECLKKEFSIDTIDEQQKIYYKFDNSADFFNDDDQIIIESIIPWKNEICVYSFSCEKSTGYFVTQGKKIISVLIDECAMVQKPSKYIIATTNADGENILIIERRSTSSVMMIYFTKDN